MASAVGAGREAPRIRVLVVGQTPPPYHGQAVMTQRVLEGAYDRVELVPVRMRFSRTLDEVGRQFNVTRERIRQIEAKALRKMRHPTRIRHLQGFIEVEEIV